MDTNILIGVLLFLLGFFFPHKRNSQTLMHTQVTCAIVLGFVLGYRRGWNQKAVNKPNEFPHLYGFDWFENHLRKIETNAIDSCYLNKLLGYESEILINNFKEEMYTEDRSEADVKFLEKAFNAVDDAKDDERFLNHVQNLWVQSAIYMSSLLAEKMVNRQSNSEHIVSVIKMFLENYKLSDRVVTKTLSYDPKAVIFIAKLLAFSIGNKELVELCEKEEAINVENRD